MARQDAVFCGIDLGSTRIKVLLLETTGRVLARTEKPTPRVADEDKIATNAEALLAEVEAMMVAAHQAAGLADPVAAVAVVGTGEEGVPVDASGMALDLAVPWFDQRAAGVAAAMSARSPWLEAPLPVALDASRTAAKWAWSRLYRPVKLANAVSWCALTDYPAARWAGRSFMSETLAARTACWHVGQRAWMQPLLADCGAPPLPPVLPGACRLGRLRSAWLEEQGVAGAQTVVVTGGHDHPAAAFVVRQQYPNAIMDSMGTAELIYAESPTLPETTAQQPPAHPFFAFSRPICGENAIACLGVIGLSAMLEPIFNNQEQLGDEFRRVMQGTPVTEGLLREKLVAITQKTAQYLSALKDLGVPEGPLFTGGGWSRSESFLCLRATILNRPIYRLAEAELAAFGAALLAARATGIFPPVRMTPRVIAPDMNKPNIDKPRVET